MFLWSSCATKTRNLRAFLNICRHRHHPVVQGAGNRPLFTCFYHSWSYALDGSLVQRAAL